jgi:hypothetical protein
MQYLKTSPVTSERFLVLARPYGPLDLEVRGEHTADEASAVKNFFFGVAGASAGQNDQAILGASLGFFQRYGGGGGRPAWTEQLEAQRSLVQRFRALGTVSVLAQWGDNEYRIGDFFRLGKEAWVCRPSTILGLCPWGAHSAVEQANVDSFLPETERSAARAILEEMAKLGIGAIVRQPSGAIRVVQDGIADNEVGTLFIAPDAPDPKAGDELSDGKSLQWSDRLGPGAFYYLAG